MVFSFVIGEMVSKYNAFITRNIQKDITTAATVFNESLVLPQQAIGFRS